MAEGLKGDDSRAAEGLQAAAAEEFAFGLESCLTGEEPEDGRTQWILAHRMHDLLKTAAGFAAARPPDDESHRHASVPLRPRNERFPNGRGEDTAAAPEAQRPPCISRIVWAYFRASHSSHFRSWLCCVG